MSDAKSPNYLPKRDAAPDGLFLKMIRLADDEKLPETHQVRLLAAEYDAACKAYILTSPPTITVKQFLGCWARARRAYSVRTGKGFLDD